MLAHHVTILLVPSRSFGLLIQKRRDIRLSVNDRLRNIDAFVEIGDSATILSVIEFKKMF